MDEKLRRSLAFDPLAYAEKITGESYKDNWDVLKLGLALQLEHNAQKQLLLQERDDTILTNDLSRYLRIVGEEGFRKVLDIPFIYTRYPNERPNERQFVFFHDEYGILLTFNTYDNQKTVNGGNFYYNWLPQYTIENIKDYNGIVKPCQVKTKNAVRCTSSGSAFLFIEQNGVEINAWEGSHDCREALRYNIRNLRENGTFITPWRKRPHLWLIDYQQTFEAESIGKGNYFEKSKFFDEKNAERFAMLPLDVQARLGVRPARKRRRPIGWAKAAAVSEPRHSAVSECEQEEKQT